MIRIPDHFMLWVSRTLGLAVKKNGPNKLSVNTVKIQQNGGKLPRKMAHPVGSNH